MSVVSDLASLQELDLALDRVLARLQEIEDALQETEELKVAREQMEEKESVVQSLRDRQKDLEWQVDEVRTKATEVESKLYGGSVRNPKELSDLDADLRALKTQTGKREDALLGLLVEIDEAEAESKKARAAYADIAGEFETLTSTLSVEKARLEPEAADLKTRRDAKVGAVDRSAVRLYELLRERKGGLGLARVEQGMCHGCRITLPAAVLQKARSGAGIVQCVSCERILFIN
jgi:predicted  nucleic acid-binding Zn-ribbon protein